MILIFTPQTRLGKWSIGFGVVFVALYLISVLLVALAQQRIGDEVTINSSVQPFLMVVGLVAIGSGLAAFFTGIVSLVKYKEKSIFIYLVTFVGFLVLLFIIGEFAFPH